jgi:general secretion pathway protein B
MSYILEALRRSQAERERGRVPGLDAQTSPAAPSGRARPALPAAWVGAGLALLLLVVVGTAMWWSRSQPGLPPPVQLAAPVPAPTPAAATVLAPPPPPLATPVPVDVPRPPATTAPTSLPQVVSAPPVQLQLPKQTAAAMRGSSAPVAQPTPGNTPTKQQPPAPVAPTAAVTPPVVPIAQLGAEQRRELPPMVFGGSIWSDNPASRFVVVNGQVVREGEAAAPLVTLERITPKTATLRWRDLRIEVPL